MLRQLDLDGDGTVTFAEFTEACKKVCGRPALYDAPVTRAWCVRGVVTKLTA